MTPQRTAPRSAAAPRPTRPRRGALAAAAAIGLMWATGGAGVHGQVASTGHHRLIETRTGVAWRLTAGRYGQATDIAAAADGTLFVLDAVNGAVHVVGADGAARAVWRVPDTADRRLVALDLEAGGDLVVLSTCRGCSAPSRVDRLTVDGAPVVQLPLEERYTDVGAHPDGRLFLTRPVDAYRLADTTPAVDIYGGDGVYEASLRDPQMSLPQRVDIGADDVVHVLQTVPPPPRTGGGGGGRPPAPGPSGRGRPIDPALRPPNAASDGIEQTVADPVPGVLVFNADLTLRRVIPFDGGVDVAAGDGLAVISGYGRVHVEGEDTPLTRVVAPSWTGEPHVAVLGPDGVAAALDHCTWQGVLWIDRLGLRPNAPSRLAGALDAPALAGPVAPARVAAGVDVALLEAPFQPVQPRTDGFDDHPSMPVPPAEAPVTQAVQAWTSAGALTHELGHCAGGRQADWARDVALARGAAAVPSLSADPPPPVYVIDDACIIQRPNTAFPGWRYCPRGLWGAGITTSLSAVGADAEHVAALDAGAAGVVIVGADGRETGHWPLASDGPGASGAAVSLAADLDLRDGVVALALRGARMIERRSLDGTVLSRFKTIDTPDAVALGPDGSVYVLGHGGWATRFAADGAVLDTWALPEDDRTPQDLTVDALGRVHIAWQRTGATGARMHQGGGVWVYAPDAATPPEHRSAGSCRVAPDKRAAPAAIPLGQAVTVTLTLQGDCPAVRGPLQLAIVFDRSRSMGWGYTMARAQRAVWAALAAVDPTSTEVGLVAFADVPAVLQPLTRDLPAIARAVGTLQPAGDTRPGDAIDAALDLLAASRRPSVPQALLIVTDGVPYDQSTAALQRLTADGVQLSAMIFQNGEDPPDALFTADLRSRSAHFVFDPTDAEAAALVGAVADAAGPAITPENVLADATVVDILPADMRYVSGSAVPPAVFDAAAASLTWRLGALRAASTATLTYRVVPQQLGLHPTNVEAYADYVDGVAAAGRVTFPVPAVTVFAPRRIYLPFAIRTACTRRSRPLDAVLAIDTSVSMTEPSGAAGGKTKLDAAVAAALAFIDQLPQTGVPATTDRAALIGFDADARLLVPLTDDRAALRAALTAARTSPGTRLDLGLTSAADALAAARPDARTAIVLLTDGRQNGQEPPVVTAAARILASGAALHVVGFGADVDEPFLRSLVAAPGDYHAAADATALLALFEGLSADLVCR
ncbi:MAG: VWA domain-containing protein [Ardenticatenales bacterium]